MLPEPGEELPLGVADGELDGFGVVLFFGEGVGETFVLFGDELGSGRGSLVDAGSACGSFGTLSTSCLASRRVASSTTEAPGGCAVINSDCSARSSSASAAACVGLSEDVAISAAS